MVYSVAYKCAKKHTSNTNDYIPHVNAVKTQPKTITPRKLHKMAKKKHQGWPIPV